MDKFKNALVNLIQIKKIIAILLTVVFVTLSLSGKIDVQAFMSVYLMVIGVYFGQSVAKSGRIDK